MVDTTFIVVLSILTFGLGFCVGGIVTLIQLENFIAKEKERDGIERKTDVI